MPAETSKRSKWCVSEEFRLVRKTGPRTDEGHFATNDVDELRQLVEAGLAEPAAERSHRVRPVELVDPVRARERAGAHRVLDVLTVNRLVDAGPHCSEFERFELVLPLTESRLPEEDRTGESRLILSAK